MMIAERVGVAGVTMRILADELGVSVATAYYHVKDKAELLRLMGDAAFAKVPCPPPGPPWDLRLVASRTTCAGQRRVIPVCSPRFRASPKAPRSRG